jgi:hypothetical protein
MTMLIIIASSTLPLLLLEGEGLWRCWSIALTITTTTNARTEPPTTTTQEEERRRSERAVEAYDRKWGEQVGKLHTQGMDW